MESTISDQFVTRFGASLLCPLSIDDFQFYDIPRQTLGVAGEGVPSHRPARGITRYVMPRTVATSLIPASPSGSIPWTIGADSASFTGPLATTSRRSNAPPAAAALLWPSRLIRLSLRGDYGFAAVGALTNWLISLMRARSSTGLVRYEETPRLWAIWRCFSPPRVVSTMIGVDFVSGRSRRHWIRS